MALWHMLSAKVVICPRIGVCMNLKQLSSPRMHGHKCPASAAMLLLAGGAFCGYSIRQAASAALHAGISQVAVRVHAVKAGAGSWQAGLQRCCHRTQPWL